MKIGLPKTEEFQKKLPKHLLPLIDDEEIFLDKTNSVSWELSTRPGTAGAAKFKKVVRVLTGTETVRQTVNWKIDLEATLTGLELTTAAEKKPVVEAMCKGAAMAAFKFNLTLALTERYNEALEEATNQDLANGNTLLADQVEANGQDYYLDDNVLKAGIEGMITTVLPRKVLARVKRSMRREMRKPQGMKIREYFMSLIRINDCELSHLPPFKNYQGVTPDEIIDILLHATPNGWFTEMEKQGFDPFVHTPEGVVAFMENIEASEVSSFKPVEKKPKTDSKSKGKKPSSGDKKPPHYCKKHGANWSHDTSDCKALASSDKEGSYGNKTWTRKSEDSSSSSKKELGALVTKMVSKEVKSAKKQLASVAKKRKSDESDSDGECFLLEQLSGNLDGFNYKEMEELEIDDDLEIDV